MSAFDRALVHSVIKYGFDSAVEIFRVGYGDSEAAWLGSLGARLQSICEFSEAALKLEYPCVRLLPNLRVHGYDKTLPASAALAESDPGWAESSQLWPEA